MKRLLIIVLLMGMTIVVRANNPLNTPYIYYYDSYLNGTVVERADGTDSHFFPYHDIEWSPSGRWFVGTMGKPAVWYPNGMSGKKYRVRFDGTQPLLIFEQTSVYDYHHKFAPHQDVLAIFDTLEVSIGENRRWDAILRLVNFETGETIAASTISNFDLDQPGYFYEMIYWQPDGAKAFFDIGNTVVSLGLDGRVIFQSKLSNGQRVQTAHKGFTLEWSLSQTEVSLTIVDQMTGKYFNFRDKAQTYPEGYIFDYQMVWNEQRTHSLITLKPCKQVIYPRECDPYKTWVLDWDDKTLTSLERSIFLDADEHGELPVLFSPNGRYVFSESYHHEHQTTEVIVVDLHTQQLMSHTTKRLESFTWTPENILILSMTPMYGGETILFDPATQLISSAPSSSYKVFPSPDGRLWGLASPSDVVNETGQVIRQWMTHSHPCAGMLWQYVWHPDSEWVIAEQSALCAGGGPGPFVGTLFNISGTVSRELPSQGSPGFLSANATMYVSMTKGQPTSWKPDPVFQIPFERGYERAAIGWHVSDSNRFAVYSNGKLFYWTLDQGTPHTTASGPVDFDSLGKTIATEYRFNLLEQGAQSTCLTAADNPSESNTILSLTETGQEVMGLWTFWGAVSFSSDGHWFAALDKQKIRIWDVSRYCS